MVLEVVVREYNEKDWPQVKEMILHAENFGPKFVDHERRIIETCRSHSGYGKVFVAESKRSRLVVGYATVEFRWRSLVIFSLVTHHNHLRRGIGKLIVKRIKEEGEKNPEMNVIRVDSGDFMSYAHKFYISCGFQICGFVAHDLS